MYTNPKNNNNCDTSYFSLVPRDLLTTTFFSYIIIIIVVVRTTPAQWPRAPRRVILAVVDAQHTHTLTR